MVKFINFTAEETLSLGNTTWEVGLTFSIELFYKSYVPAKLLGWEEGAFLMTTPVTAQGDQAGVKSNDAIKMRFLKEGNAYGCIAEVIHIQHYPFPLMFIKYPTNIECVKLRVSPRIKIYLPAILHDASGAVISPDATMLDISEGGCRVVVPAREGLKLSPDAPCAITFLARDKEFKVACDMKQLKDETEFHSLGLEFRKDSDQFKQELSSFLDFLSKYARA